MTKFNNTKSHVMRVYISKTRQQILSVLFMTSKEKHQNEGEEM